MYFFVGTSKDENGKNDCVDYQFWLIKSEPNDRYENGSNVKVGN